MAVGSSSRIRIPDIESSIAQISSPAHITSLGSTFRPDTPWARHEVPFSIQDLMNEAAPSGLHGIWYERIRQCRILHLLANTRRPYCIRRARASRKVEGLWNRDAKATLPM